MPFTLCILHCRGPPLASSLLLCTTDQMKTMLHRTVEEFSTLEANFQLLKAMDWLFVFQEGLRNIILCRLLHHGKKNVVYTHSLVQYNRYQWGTVPVFSEFLHNISSIRLCTTSVYRTYAFQFSLQHALRSTHAAVPIDLLSHMYASAEISYMHTTE